MGTNHHSVTVKTRLDDEGTPDEERRVESVQFVCTAPADADCRTYPECQCETFNWAEDKTRDIEGHPRVSGRDCWMGDWFEAEGAVYVGDDYDDMRDDCIPAIERGGHITVFFQEEWIEWKWAEPIVDEAAAQRAALAEQSKHYTETPMNSDDGRDE